MTHSQAVKPNHAAAERSVVARLRRIFQQLRRSLDELLNSDVVARLRRRWRRWRRRLPWNRGRQRHGRSGRPPVGRRPPAGRRIADQLRLIVAVPLVAVVGFAGLALLTTAQQASRTGQLRELAVLASDAGALSHALQNERAAAAGLLVTGSPIQLDAYAEKTGATDAAAKGYRGRRATISEDQTGAADLLRRIDAGLATLPDLRRQVRSSSQASLSAVAFSYRIVIADLISYRDAVVRAGAPTGIADGIHAAAALSRAAEAIGRQQVAVLRAVSPGQLTPALRQEITAARGSFDESTVSFSELAKPEWRDWYERANVGEDVLAAQRLQDEVARAQQGSIQIDPSNWIAAMSAWVARLSAVQQRIDRAVVDEVTRVRDGQMREAGTEAGGVAFVLVVAVLLTGFVARRITRRLRLLHDAARTVAYQRLPTVVAELYGAAPGTVDPDEVANRSAAEVAVGGVDEIAEVAQAFRAVHREAVRIAGEQAVMRSNVAEIFVHLSRREQRLVDAVLAQVDLVERDETDPDRLQQLYQLDHLATRMARINLSLLVLGGSGAARVRREDAPLVKVLQAAISQIEHYKRVRFGLVDNDVAVVSEAVDEVVHLLAELLDNATSYSPAESEVWIAGRALGDRIIIQIGDEGVGLSPRRRAQLNELLSAPPAIDIAAVRAMGLTVVGHIAARYDIKVELRPSQGTGTIAEITLPGRVFQAFVPADRQLPPRPLPSAERPGAGNGARELGGIASGVAADRISVDGGVPARSLFTPTRDPVAAPPGPGAWPPHPAPIAPVGLVAPVDETILLPIFQETSGWFQIANPSAAGADGPINWESAADAGWLAAAQAATPEVSATTASGLPVRMPQRHLVPGAAASEQSDGGRKRDPASIAAAMSAYARGVAGRRGTQAQ